MRLSADRHGAWPAWLGLLRQLELAGHLLWVCDGPFPSHPAIISWRRAT